MICHEGDAKGHKELQKLQLMLRNLEEFNDLPSPEKAKIQSEAFMERSCQDSVHSQMDFLKSNPSTDTQSLPVLLADSGYIPAARNESLNKSLLEDLNDLSDVEEDIVLDEEDNWLLETAGKTPKKPQIWLSQDVKTPELARVKGTLASKLDLISIQNRKEKLSQLLWKHNLGSHAESAPGRLYQAESMCSVMSLDWEYDEDSGQMNYGRAKPASGHTDSPKHRKLIHSFDSDDDHAFDELQPMSLDFQSLPVLKRSMQVAPGPVITRRGGSKKSPDQFDSPNDMIVKPMGSVRPRRSRPAEYKRSDSCDSGTSVPHRRSSLSDRSDSSGEVQISPQNSISSSRSSLGSVEDLGVQKNRRRATGRRIFVPIASFFETSIAEGNEEAESPDTYQDTYMAWDILQRRSEPSTKQKIGTLQSSVVARGIPKQNMLSIKPRTSNSSERGEENLLVKLPSSSQDGPVIRRRGASPRASSNDNVPRQRVANESSEVRHGVPSMSKSSTVRPRQSAPPVRRSMPTPRGFNSSEKFGRSQSPDILSRRGRSPERRSASPDIISRRSGVVPRGQAVSNSYQASNF